MDSLSESSEANVAGEHCAQLAMMMPLPWGAGRAMLGARDGRSAQPARCYAVTCYAVTEQPEIGMRSWSSRATIEERVGVEFSTHRTSGMLGSSRRGERLAAGGGAGSLRGQRQRE